MYLAGAKNTDNSIGIWHIQNQISVMGNHHELGQSRPPEKCIVCHFEIGYLKLYLLGTIILTSLECYGKSDLTDKGCYDAQHYSRKRSSAQS
jgi:hypothetical protein